MGDTAKTLAELLPVARVPETAETCRGLVFRGYRSLFRHGDRVELRQGVRLLKKKSCPGCEKCGYLLDDINEAIACESLIFPDITDGAEYSVRITNTSTDWETGCLDSWDTEIFQLPAPA